MGKMVKNSRAGREHRGGRRYDDVRRRVLPLGRPTAPSRMEFQPPGVPTRGIGIDDAPERRTGEQGGHELRHGAHGRVGRVDIARGSRPTRGGEPDPLPPPGARDERFPRRWHGVVHGISRFRRGLVLHGRGDRTAEEHAPSDHVHDRDTHELLRGGHTRIVGDAPVRSDKPRGGIPRCLRGAGRRVGEHGRESRRARFPPPRRPRRPHGPTPPHVRLSVRRPNAAVVRGRGRDGEHEERHSLRRGTHDPHRVFRAIAVPERFHIRRRPRGVLHDEFVPRTA